MWYCISIRTTGCHSATQKSKLLVHSTMWTDLTNVLLIETNPTQLYIKILGNPNLKQRADGWIPGAGDESRNYKWAQGNFGGWRCSKTGF